jgi:flavin-dependent dehydrogenase
MKKKIIVIGAGTAGLIFAKKAGDLGLEVEVYDQNPAPGNPARASGIISINGLKSIGLDYGNMAGNIFYGADIYCGKEVMHIKSQHPQAYAINRTELNRRLLNECKDAGIEIKTGKRLNTEDILSLSKEHIIVGADGFNSEVARAFRFHSYGDQILTYRAEYEGAILEDNSVVKLFFDRKGMPGFFGWIAAESKDIIEVGLGIDRAYGNSKKAFDMFIADSRIQEVMGNAKMRSGWASVIPIGLRRRFVDEKNEVLLIGDAAGHVKPTTGGGIIFGGSAALKAAHAVKAYTEGRCSLAKYEQEWRRDFMNDFRMHSLAHWLYSNMSVKQMSNTMKLMKRIGIERLLSEKGDMDRPTLMLKRMLHLVY